MEKKGGNHPDTNASELPNQPEKVAEATINAMANGDAAAFKSLMPENSTLRSLLLCEGENRFQEKIDKNREKSDLEAKKITEMKSQGFRITFQQASASPAVERKKGTKIEGCTLRRDVQTTNAKAKITIKRKNKVTTAEENMQLIRIDGKWYLLGL